VQKEKKQEELNYLLEIAQANREEISRLVLDQTMKVMVAGLVLDQGTLQV